MKHLYLAIHNITLVPTVKVCHWMCETSGIFSLDDLLEEQGVCIECHWNFEVKSVLMGLVLYSFYGQNVFQIS